MTSIVDLISRKIIGWILSKTLEVSCVVDTINKAKASQNTDRPLIIYSDRGSWYVSKVYQEASAKMQRSYSKRDFPWNNVCNELFHAFIKRVWLNRFKICGYQQTYHLVFEYLEVFDHSKRSYS